jgi:hypothetical protein
MGPRVPTSFRDVLDPTDRHARQVHLDENFLNRALAQSLTLDHSRLKRLRSNLRHVQRTSLGLVCSLR